MFKKISALVLLSAFLFSCSTSNNVVNNGIFQKRKHNKGWHHKGGSNLKSNNDISKLEKNAIEINSPSTIRTNQNTVTKSASTIVVSNENIELVSTELDQSKNTDENTLRKSKTKLTQEKYSEKLIEKKGSTIKNTNDSNKFKKEEKQNNSQRGSEVSIVLLVILEILLPPAAVYLARGIGNEFWISLILTLLFWFPGIVYAMLIVFDVI